MPLQFSRNSSATSVQTKAKSSTLQQKPNFSWTVYQHHPQSSLPGGVNMQTLTILKFPSLLCYVGSCCVRLHAALDTEL